MIPTFRQCATGLVIAGNAWWLGINTASNVPLTPTFDPPSHALPIENFQQDRPGQDAWRWSGAFSGNRTVINLQRGDCVDIYVPGAPGSPVVSIDEWSPGDWDLDGVLDSADISAFLSAWIATIGTPNSDADYNLDGVVNSGDISSFMVAWLSN